MELAMHTALPITVIILMLKIGGAWLVTSLFLTTVESYLFRQTDIVVQQPRADPLYVPQDSAVIKMFVDTMLLVAELTVPAATVYVEVSSLLSPDSVGQ